VYLRESVRTRVASEKMGSPWCELSAVWGENHLRQGVGVWGGGHLTGRRGVGRFVSEFKRTVGRFTCIERNVGEIKILKTDEE